MQITKNLTLKALNQLELKTPFFLIDLDEIKIRYQTLAECMPNCKVYYAMKANPEERILKTLDNEGSKFEIASIGELHRLEKIGVKPKTVIFSNPIKIVKHIKEAHKAGVEYFAFDSLSELEKIASNAPGAKVFLRIAVSNRGSLIELASKFGAEPMHATSLMGSAQDLGLKPIGLAFHVGSQAENISVWDAAFETVADIRSRLKKAGIDIRALNIGGGFPIRYSGPIPLVSEIAEKIKDNIRRFELDDLEHWCEPGRYLVGTSGIIGGSVILRTARHQHEWLYLDVGRFQAFAEMFESEDIQYPVYVSSRTDTKSIPQNFVVTGPTCDSYDTIFKGIDLPNTVKEGDRLYFANAGAYTTVYGSEFNDFPLPEVCYLQDIA